MCREAAESDDADDEMIREDDSDREIVGKLVSAIGAEDGLTQCSRASRGRGSQLKRPRRTALHAERLKEKEFTYLSLVASSTSWVTSARSSCPFCCVR
jgi:hypothetical protein